MTTTTQAAGLTRRSIWAFRGPLLVGSLIGLGYAIAALVGYPAPVLQTALYWVAVALLVGCVTLAWLSARVSALQRPEIVRWSALFGLVCGGFWIIEMVLGNVIPLPTGTGLQVYRGFYLASAAVAFVTPLVAGFVAASATGRITAGLSVGFWTGFVSGLVGYLTLMFLTYAFLSSFSHDPQNLSQYAASHAHDQGQSLASWVVGDSLFASVSHLLAIGFVWGTMGGAGGALVGRLFRRRNAAPGTG